MGLLATFEFIDQIGQTSVQLGITVPADKGGDGREVVAGEVTAQTYMGAFPAA